MDHNANEVIELTISIVNTNNRTLLARCLDTIATSVGDVRHEVIVVDNASTDGSVEMLRACYPLVQVIENQARDGYGRSHNRAIRVARGEHVLILNEDMEMIGDAVARMVHIARAIPNLGVLGCRILNPDGSLQHSCFRDPTLRGELFEALLPYTLAFPRSRMRSKMYWWPHDARREVDIVVGCCMLVPRSVLSTVGMFDPDFFIYSEEHDYCRRVRNRGLRVVFTPDAEMIHFGGQTTRRMSQRMALVQLDSRIRYFRKHRGPMPTLLFRAILLLSAAVRLAGWSAVYLVRRRRSPTVTEKVSEYAVSLKFVLGTVVSI